MQKELTSLLERLRNERARIAAAKQRHVGMLRELGAERAEKARIALQFLLPDIAMTSMDRLKRLIPGFPIPTESTWFGLSRRVKPGTTVENLRIQLGIHLDTSEQWEVVKTDQTQVVYKLDETIERRQTETIPNLSREIQDLDERIAALEKFLAADHSKINSDQLDRMRRAITTVAKQSSSFGDTKATHIRSSAQPVYRDRIEDGGDFDLIGAWFWWQVLSPESEFSSHNLAGGEGSVTRAAAPPELIDSSTGPNDADLAHHATLGSQSFS